MAEQLNLNELSDDALIAIARGKKFANKNAAEGYSKLSPAMKALGEKAPSGILSSTYRDATLNKKVGGVPTSAHLTGNAKDYLLDENTPDLQKYYQDKGMKTLIHDVGSGKHLHVEGDPDLNKLSNEELAKIAGVKLKTKQVSPQAGRYANKGDNKLSAPVAFFRKGTQAATLGLSEPTAAGISALITKAINPNEQIGDLYNRFREKQKLSISNQENENKAASTLGQIVGLLAPTGLASGVFKGAEKIAESGGKLVSKVAPSVVERTPQYIQWALKNALEGGIGGGIAAGVNPDDNTSALEGASAGAIIQPVIGSVGKGISSLGSKIKQGAARLMNRALETPTKYITGEQDLGKFVLENMGPFTSLEKLSVKNQKTIDSLEESLQSLLKGKEGQKVNQHTIFKNLIKLKERAQNTPGAAKQVEAIDNHIEEILQNPKFRRPDVPTANELKRNITRQRQGKAYETETPSIKQEIDKATAAGYREAVEEQVPTSSYLNKSMIPHIQLNKTLTKTLAKEKTGTPISLRDIIVGALGTSLGGYPGALAGGASYLSKTKPGQLAASQTMNAIGESIAPIGSGIEGLSEIIAPLLFLNRKEATQASQ